ncbi:MAG: hypothetical protein IJ341_01755 [Bacteroidales bacterium]|nr:hypothetical protein [Bacteroidales bacterium]
MNKSENNMFMYEEDAPLYCGNCSLGKRECISCNDDYDETFVSGQREVVVNDYEETLIRCPYTEKLHHLSDVCIHLDKNEVKEMLLKNCSNCVNHTLVELPVKPKEDVASTIAMIVQEDTNKGILCMDKVGFEALKNKVKETTLFCGDCPLGTVSTIPGNGIGEPPYISVVRCPYDKEYYHHFDDECMYPKKLQEIQKSATPECPYCRNNTTEDIPIKSNADVSRTVALIAQGDNKKEIVFSHKGTAFGIEINFCPICGRELNK